MGERPEWAPEKIFVLDMWALELYEADFSYCNSESLARYETYPGHPWIELHRFQGELESHVTVEETGNVIGRWFRTEKELLQAAMGEGCERMTKLEEFVGKVRVRMLERMGEKKGD